MENHSKGSDNVLCVLKSEYEIETESTALISIIKGAITLTIQLYFLEKVMEIKNDTNGRKNAHSAQVSIQVYDVSPFKTSVF